MPMSIRNLNPPNASPMISSTKAHLPPANTSIPNRRSSGNYNPSSSPALPSGNLLLKTTRLRTPKLPAKRPQIKWGGKRKWVRKRGTKMKECRQLSRACGILFFTILEYWILSSICSHPRNLWNWPCSTAGCIRSSSSTAFSIGPIIGISLPIFSTGKSKTSPKYLTTNCWTSLTMRKVSTPSTLTGCSLCFCPMRIQLSKLLEWIR